MPDGKNPLSYCPVTNTGQSINDGTLCRAASQTPTSVGFSIGMSDSTVTAPSSSRYFGRDRAGDAHLETWLSGTSKVFNLADITKEAVDCFRSGKLSVGRLPPEAVDIINTIADRLKRVLPAKLLWSLPTEGSPFDVSHLGAISVIVDGINEGFKHKHDFDGIMAATGNVEGKVALCVIVIPIGIGVAGAAEGAALAGLGLGISGLLVDPVLNHFGKPGIGETAGMVGEEAVRIVIDAFRHNRDFVNLLRRFAPKETPAAITQSASSEHGPASTSVSKAHHPAHKRDLSPVARPARDSGLVHPAEVEALHQQGKGTKIIILRAPRRDEPPLAGLNSTPERR